MTAFGMTNVLGQLSGVIIISAGVVVFTMRWKYWREAKVRTEFAARAQGEDELMLLRISWSKKYESGNLIIDEQHKQLFNLANALLNAILENKPSNEICVFIDLLLKDVQHHLLTEEKILADLKHPITIEHKTVHEQLLAHAKSIVNKYRHGTLLFGELSEFITYDLIAQHIATEDKQYFISHPGSDLNMPGVASVSSHETRQSSSDIPA
jgi:hemerythrin-like metal-binding protein